MMNNSTICKRVLIATALASGFASVGVAASAQTTSAPTTSTNATSAAPSTADSQANTIGVSSTSWNADNTPTASVDSGMMRSKTNVDPNDQSYSFKQPTNAWTKPQNWEANDSDLLGRGL